MDSDTRINPQQLGEPVSAADLNSWRRGFTPQAEIWNGRMAMFGLVVGISGLMLMRIFYSN